MWLKTFSNDINRSLANILTNGESFEATTKLWLQGECTI